MKRADIIRALSGAAACLMCLSVFAGVSAEVTDNSEYIEADTYFREETEEVGVTVSGDDCGNALSWKLDSDGMLTITGTGSMYNFSDSNYYINPAPWYNYRSSITDITIGAEVTSIGDYAFNGLVNLRSVSINGRKLERVGKYSFMNCTSLRVILLPESVNYVGTGAFTGCTKLLDMTLPEGIAEVYPYTFNNCSSLKQVYIPEAVTAIGEKAFWGCSALTSVDIPSMVRSIEPGCFSGCSSLTSVNFPLGLTSVKENAFIDCSALKEIVFPDCLTSVGSYAFKGCYSLNKLVLSESMTSIPESAFEGCASLTFVHIPENVHYIGLNAFNGCKNLECAELTTPLEIRDGAFSSCPSLTHIHIPYGENYTYYRTRGDLSYDPEHYFVLNADGSCPARNNCPVFSYSTSNPFISGYPADITVSDGELATFLVAVYSPMIYRWQWSPDCINWVDITNSNSYVLQFTAKESDDGYYYRCVAKYQGFPNEYYSNPAKLTIKKSMKLVKEPKDYTESYGGLAVFEAEATGSGITYQWQMRPDSSSQWQNCGGVTAQSPVFNAGTVISDMKGYQYRCLIKDAYGREMYTRAATIRAVSAIYVSPSSPVSRSVFVGDTAEFNAVAAGAGLKYKWEYSYGGDNFMPCDGDASSATYRTKPVTAGMDGWKYRCVITDAYGCKEITSVAELKVISNIEIIQQPEGATVPIGKNVKFKVRATGLGLKYKWYYRYPGYGWEECKEDSAETAELLISHANKDIDGIYIFCEVTDRNNQIIGTTPVRLAVKNVDDVSVNTVQEMEPDELRYYVNAFSKNASGSTELTAGQLAAIKKVMELDRLRK